MSTRSCTYTSFFVSVLGLKFSRVEVWNAVSYGGMELHVVHIVLCIRSTLYNIDSSLQSVWLNASIQRKTPAIPDVRSFMVESLSSLRAPPAGAREHIRDRFSRISTPDRPISVAFILHLSPSLSFCPVFVYYLYTYSIHGKPETRSRFTTDVFRSSGRRFSKYDVAGEK